MKKILFTLAILVFYLAAHGQKVTALTEAATAGETSLLIVREGATGDLLKRITMAHLFTGRTLAGTTVLPSTTSIGTVSSTELGYLDGVTSNIQDQLGTKGEGMQYPTGSGIPLVVAGASWGTTIAVSSAENYSSENYGATGTGDIVLSIGATMTSPNIINTPVSTGTVVAGTGITSVMLSRFMYFNTAAAIDITADPQIANGVTGQIITIIGSSDANTLTLDDTTGLRLTAAMILGIGDNITLFYEGTIGDWIEISRSNN